MFGRSKKKRNLKSKSALCNRIDCHRWESKMEVIRLISGKPELKLKTFPE